MIATESKNDISSVLAKLESLGKKVKSNGQDMYICQCPAHDDNRPSLQVTKSSDKVLMRCFAGCSYKDITTALGFTDTNQRFNYADRQGNIKYQVNKTPDKQFPVSKPDGSAGITGIERVLYRLPELLVCTNGEYVFIPEGEKDCDTLACLGLTATTNLGGAGKWKPEYNEYLKNRKVVLLPDNDEAGRKHVQQVAESLLGIAAEVRIVILDDLPPKGDVTDWMQTGGDVDGLMLRVDEAKPIKAKPVAGKIAFQPIADIEDKPLVWFWDDKIPDCGISMIQGDPGVSKSFLTIFMAAHISKGKPWPDCPDVPVKKGSVLIISGEDAPARIKERCKWHGADMSRIFVSSGNTQLDIRQHLPALQTILDGLEDKCRLIIFDPITAYMGNAKENSNNEVRAALEPLSDFADDNELCIISINHMNKDVGKKHVYRGLGSMGFTAVARSVWNVVWDESDEEHETRIMAPVKTNYSRHPSGLKYQIIDNAIQFKSEPYYGNIDEESDKVKDGKETKAEIAADWLRDRLKDGSVAQKLIEEEADEAGIKSGTLWRAKKIVGIKSEKETDVYGGWFWSIADGTEG